jgi:hypothetical protein
MQRERALSLQLKLTGWQVNVTIYSYAQNSPKLGRRRPRRSLVSASVAHTVSANVQQATEGDWLRRACAMCRSFHTWPQSHGKQPTVSTTQRVGWTPQPMWSWVETERTLSCRQSTPGPSQSFYRLNYNDSSQWPAGTREYEAEFKAS